MSSDTMPVEISNRKLTDPRILAQKILGVSSTDEEKLKLPQTNNVMEFQRAVKHRKKLQRTIITPVTRKIRNVARKPR